MLKWNEGDHDGTALHWQESLKLPVISKTRSIVEQVSPRYRWLTISYPILPSERGVHAVSGTLLASGSSHCHLQSSRFFDCLWMPYSPNRSSLLIQTFLKTVTLWAWCWGFVWSTWPYNTLPYPCIWSILNLCHYIDQSFPPQCNTKNLNSLLSTALYHHTEAMQYLVCMLTPFLADHSTTQTGHLIIIAQALTTMLKSGSSNTWIQTKQLPVSLSMVQTFHQ